MTIYYIYEKNNLIKGEKYLFRNKFLVLQLQITFKIN